MWRRATALFYKIKGHWFEYGQDLFFYASGKWSVRQNNICRTAVGLIFCLSCRSTKSAYNSGILFHIYASEQLVFLVRTFFFSNLTRKQKCTLKVFTCVPFCYNHDLEHWNFYSICSRLYFWLLFDDLASVAEWLVREIHNF